jgi:hypothetical protein
LNFSSDEKTFPLPAFKKLNCCPEKDRTSSGLRSKRPTSRVIWFNEDCSLDQYGTSANEKLQTKDCMVMGRTKDLHEIDEGGDDNALPCRHCQNETTSSERFSAFFLFYDGADDLATANEQYFYIDPFQGM